MAGLFKNLKRGSKDKNKSLIQKSKSRATTGVSVRGSGNSNSLLDRISMINALVHKVLGDSIEKYRILTTEDELVSYFDAVLENGILSFDTETNSLDPITCTLAGVCLYTPGQPSVYVPMHHVSYVTGQHVKDQLSDEIVREQLLRIDDSVELIMHNGKFDIRVIKNQLDVDLGDYLKHDTFIGAHLLNENEPSKKLKHLWNKYCNEGKGEKADYESLFDDIPFTHIPVQTAYLYAARDALITYELYEFQKPFLDAESEVCKEHGLSRLSKLFHEIEIPLVKVIAEMEDNGVSIDVDYANELSVEYTQKLKEVEDEFQHLCSRYDDTISLYKRMNPGHKLGDTISPTSTTQLACLFYDVLGLQSPDAGKPRGTGEDILKQLDSPFSEVVLKHRGLAKLLSTYINKLPNSLCAKTLKIHASFNQAGTDTGRLSSNDPNLQNIPSKDRKIRKIFIPSDGYLMIAADYSQQEPRILTHFSGDENLIAAYAEGKDIYAFIGSMSFNVAYEDCLEYKDGAFNAEGKKRRQIAKALVLGIMYGRGPSSIAAELGIKLKEAENIISSFFTAFPKVKQFIDKSIAFARENGYVETVWGRKRRLPNMLLDEYDFKFVGAASPNFDPLFDNEEEEGEDQEMLDAIIDEYWTALSNCRGWKQKQNIFAKAKAEGIEIKDNGALISAAERQCVNSRIQGSAADMVKLAMVNLSKCEEFYELGGRMIMQVHDELIVEAPAENAFKVARLLREVMLEAPKEMVSVPMKCDVDVLDRWYGEELKEVA